MTTHLCPGMYSTYAQVCVQSKHQLQHYKYFYVLLPWTVSIFTDVPAVEKLVATPINPQN